MPVFTELTVQLARGTTMRKEMICIENALSYERARHGGALEPGVEDRLGLRVFIARSGNPC